MHTVMELFNKKIKISNNTILIYDMAHSYKSVPAFIRNIIYIDDDNGEKCDKIKFELLGISVVTTSKKVCNYIENAIYRKYKLDCIKSSNFANSGSYMGTKKIARVHN